MTEVSNADDDDVEERLLELGRGRQGSYLREAEPGGRGVPQEDSEPAQEAVGRGGWLRDHRFFGYPEELEGG